MNQYVGRRLSHYVTAILLLFCSLVAFAGPGRTTYQAKIVKPDGHPLEASNVNFKFTILDPAGTCIVYSETYSAVNMTSTGGLISFSLGSGVKTYPTSSPTFADVFSNITPVLSCDAGGPPTYSPAATDSRKIVMQFHDGSGWQTLPAMNINAVPYAMYADEATRVGGKLASDFVEVSTIPTCSGSQAITFNGTTFSCIVSGGGPSVSSGSVTTALGYTPADGASVTALTADVNAVSATVNSVSFEVASVSSTVFSVSSTVSTLSNTVSAISTSISNLSASMAAIVSSQWVTSGTQITYSSGNIAVSGSVKISMDLTACSSGLAGTIRYNSGNLEYCNGTSWSTLGVAGAGITLFNGSASGSQTFASGNSGTEFNISTSNGIHSFNIPSAASAAVTQGFLSNADYLAFSNKANSASLTAVASDLTSLSNSTAASLSAIVSSQWVTSGTTINYSVGNVGIGVANPTAKLHIGSGTATAAPIKIVSGTLLASPQSGTIEYDGINYYVTDGTNTRRAIAMATAAGAYDNVNAINSTGNITLTPTGSVVVSSTAVSVNSSTGALIVNGGVGVAGNINAGGSISASGNITATTLYATSATITPFLEVIKNFNGQTNTHAAFIGGVDAGYSDTGVYFMRKDNTSLGSPFSQLFNVVTNGVSKLSVDGTGQTNVGGNIRMAASATHSISSWSNLELAADDDGSGSEAMIFKNGGTEKMRLMANGSLGIGTATPASRLSVHSTNHPQTSIQFDPNEGSADPAIRLYRTTGGGGLAYPVAIQNTVNAETNGGDLAFRTGAPAVPGAETLVTRMLLTSAGNLGLGGQPSNANGWARVLDVFAPAHAKIIATQSLGGISVGTGVFSHGLTGNGYGGYPVSHGGVGFVGTETNHDLGIITSNTTRISITNDGRVGVGTIAPAVKFHVSGGDLAVSDNSYPGLYTVNTGKTDGTYGRTWGWLNYGGGLYLNAYASTGNSFAPGAPVTAMSIYDTTGNIGFGTTTAPDEKLRVVGKIKVGTETDNISANLLSQFNNVLELVSPGATSSPAAVFHHRGLHSVHLGSWGTSVTEQGLQIKSGTGEAPAQFRAQSHITSNNGNLHTVRGRLAFSNTPTDNNHTIYNNFYNLDGEGVWDGMKMNVYNGLSIRVGESNIASPTAALHINASGYTGLGTSAPTQRLDVAGNVKATAFIGDGSQLTNIPASALQFYEFDSGWAAGMLPFSSYATGMSGWQDYTGTGTGVGSTFWSGWTTKNGAQGAQLGINWNVEAGQTAGVAVRGKDDTQGNWGTWRYLAFTDASVQKAGDTMTGALTINSDLTITGTPYRASGDIAWTVPSDARLKDVRRSYTRGLKEILNIDTIIYNYKDGNIKNIDADKEFTGVLAQNVQDNIPEAVKVDKDGFLSLNTTPIFWAMINAIKDLYHEVTGVQREIASLKEDNKAKEQEIKELKERLDRIEKSLQNK